MNPIDQNTEIFGIFKTSLKDIYKIPQNPINIKTSATNTELNELLKQILAKLNKECNEDFDFLINNDILRGDLRSHLLKNKIENEKNITLEYTIATKEPKPDKTLDTQNWLNKFFMIDDELISCFFNGDIKIFNKEFDINLEFNILPLADENQKNINSYCILENADYNTIVACNYFGELYACLVQDKDVSTHKLVDLETVIECFYANPLSGNLFCSGDANGSICIWDLKGNNKSEIVRSKEHLHGGSFTNLMWINEQEILSSGMDDQLTISDVNTLKPKYSIYTKDNTITSLDYSARMQTVLSGHVNGVIRLFDDRKRDKTSAAQFKSHNSFVSTIKYCTENDNIFVSGCYDGKIKLWDFRMNLPLYTINSHGDEKLFDISWLCKLNSK